MDENLHRENRDINNVSQREYFERWLIGCRKQCVGDIAQLKELLGTRLDNMQANVSVAKEATENRFINVNEWRLTVTDLISGKANTVDLKRVEDDIRLLRESKATLEGKASQQSVYIGYLLGLGGLVMAAIALFRG